MIRLFDLLFSIIGLVLLFPLIIMLWIIGLITNGSPIFLQYRVGYKQKLFLLIKFRTMKINTKSAPTHLVDSSKITPFGNFLRKNKFDEIPQLINVFLGDMSLVGPRPSLSNQTKLINERKKRGIFNVKPGITGLAQISKIDMRKPLLLAKTDFQMIKKMNLYYYFYYIIMTLIILIKKD